VSHPYAAPALSSAPATRGTRIDPGVFVGAWIAPRRVVRDVLAQEPTYAWWALAGMAGLMSVTVGTELEPVYVAGMAVAMLALAIPLGLLSLGLGGLMTYVGASILGHPAQLRELTIAYAWGQVPSGMAALPVWAWAVAASVLRFDATVALAGLIGLALVAVAGRLWSVVTTAHAVGEVLGTSAWTGWLAVNLPGLLLGGLMLIVMIGVIAS